MYFLQIFWLGGMLRRAELFFFATYPTPKTLIAATRERSDLCNLRRPLQPPANSPNPVCVLLSRDSLTGDRPSRLFSTAGERCLLPATCNRFFSIPVLFSSSSLFQVVLLGPCKLILVAVTAATCCDFSGGDITGDDKNSHRRSRSPLPFFR